MTFVLVGLGGLLGAISRYLLSQWINRQWQTSFPLATFLVNLSGSFLLGALTAYHLAHYSLSLDNLQLLLGMGYLGAFTTFSTFIYETISLSQQQKKIAFLYSFLSIAGGLLSCWLGFSFFL